MGRAIPTVRDGWLVAGGTSDGDPTPGTDDGSAVQVGTPAWYTWLEGARSFSFTGSMGIFTARKEQRQRGGWYWKAYRTIGGKPARAYLGKGADLTLDQLERTARALAAPQAPGHTEPRRAATSTGALTRRARHEVTPNSQHFAREPLLATKIAPPPLLPGLIARDRLAALAGQMAGGNVTLLSAPAGFGKTTLLRQWCARSGRPIAWVALDIGDNDPIRFWRYVIAALDTVVPGASADAMDLLRVPSAPVLEGMLASLVNGLLVARDVILVLDDYHLITAPEVHDSIVFLLDHLPISLHVVLAGRDDPPLPLARLRMRQRLREVRTSELRFTPDEVAAFLSAQLGDRLDADAVTLLSASTEGWIAALQLAALSLRQHDTAQGSLSHNLRHSLEALTSGQHWAIVDYLAEEVFQRQSAETQGFLLRTAFLDRLCGPLCDAVADDHAPGHGHGQIMLERLERANLFLVPLDAERRWYRYHHLFAEFLRGRARWTAPAQIALAHQRAACWYEGQQLTAEAIPHALAAGDNQLAARLVTRLGGQLVRGGEIATLARWLAQLPDPLVRAAPRLCLLRAWIAVTLGQHDDAERWLRAAEKTLARHPAAEGVAAGGVSQAATAPVGAKDGDYEAEQDVRGLLGEIAALRAHSAAFWGDHPATITFAHQALTRLAATDPYLRGLSALNLGIAYWLQGDLPAADRALAQAREIGLDTGNHYVALIATCGLAQVQIVQGRRRAAFATGEQALRLAEESRGGALPAAAYAYAGMGQILYERNELAEATCHLERALALSSQWNNGDMLVYSYTVLAQVKQAQGDLPAAQDAISQAERVVERFQQRPWIVAIMVAQQIRLALARGEFDVVDHWLRDAEPGFVGAYEQVTQARIHLARGQPNEGLTIIEGRLAQAEKGGQTGSVIELCTLQALALQQQGEMARAAAALERALALAEPEGYIRLFVDEGLPMAHLLLHLLVHRSGGRTPPGQASARYIRTLEGAITRTATELPEATRRPERGGAPSDPLSEREVAIVRCLAAGMSNEAIARELVLEVSTVKWHLTRIYGKLNIRTRTQAAIQARELHLL